MPSLIQPRETAEGGNRRATTRVRLRGKNRERVSEIAGMAVAMATDTPLAAIDLDEVEAKVVAILSADDGLSLDNAEVAKRAGCAVTTYWRMRQNPAFEARRRAIVLQHLNGKLGAVIDETIKSALIHGREGSADRRLIFEASGLILNRHEIKSDVSVNHTGDMPDAQLVWYYLLLKWPMERWLPGVRQRYELGQIVAAAPDVPLPGLPMSDQPLEGIKHVASQPVGNPRPAPDAQAQRDQSGQGKGKE